MWNNIGFVGFGEGQTAGFADKVLKHKFHSISGKLSFWVVETKWHTVWTTSVLFHSA